MLNPEDFSRQLDEALVAKQVVDQEEVAVARLQAIARRQEASAQAVAKATKEAEKEGQRNQAVLDLDAQLPIQQYLEILKDKIEPKERVERWGPEAGVIAYAFSYGLRIKKIIDSPEGYSKLMSASDRAGHTSYWRNHYLEESHLELQKRVFGITLNEPSGKINIYHEVIGHKIPDKIITPFVLNPFSRRSCGWDQKTPMAKVYLSSQEAPQQFVQSLINFYAGARGNN